MSGNFYLARHVPAFQGRTFPKEKCVFSLLPTFLRSSSQSEQRKEEKCLFFKSCLIFVFPLMFLILAADRPNFVDPGLPPQKCLKICVRWLQNHDSSVPSEFMAPRLPKRRKMERPKNHAKLGLDGLVQQGSTTSFNHKREYGSIKSSRRLNFSKPRNQKKHPKRQVYQKATRRKL